MYMANLVLCLSTVPFIAERDKELIKKKPRRINKSEKSADATLHEELHGLFLDLCVEDKEIHTSPCLYLSFQPLQKKTRGEGESKCNHSGIILWQHFFILDY